MEFKSIKIGHIMKTSGAYGTFYLKLNNNLSQNAVSLSTFTLGTITATFELEDLGEIPKPTLPNQ